MAALAFRALATPLTPIVALRPAAREYDLSGPRDCGSDLALASQAPLCFPSDECGSMGCEHIAEIRQPRIYHLRVHGVVAAWSRYIRFILPPFLFSCPCFCSDFSRLILEQVLEGVGAQFSEILPPRSPNVPARTGGSPGQAEGSFTQSTSPVISSPHDVLKVISDGGLEMLYPPWAPLVAYQPTARIGMMIILRYFSKSPPAGRCP
jgi:hypothetical protein